jgi:hypothetical protein
MAARITREYQDVIGRQECARGDWCSAKTRDHEGEWHPAAASQHLCAADQDVMLAFLGELPGMYQRLGQVLTDPVRRARPVRVSPGSRVLVSGEADELMHDIADQLGGWAVRVRAVPQLQLALPAAAYGTVERVTADCATLAAHPAPLLALTPAKALRTWAFPPPRLAASRPRPVPCRRCRLPVSPSPSWKYWWPAQCTHAGPLLAAGDRDDKGRDSRLMCSACGKLLPAGWQSPPPCRHEGTGAPFRASPIPPLIEEQIEGLEVVRAGDGWVTCLTALGGRAAALDVLDLRSRSMRLLRESPAPQDLLDGIPCRSCDAPEGVLEVLPAAPPDEREHEPDFSRCTKCGDRMTRTDYNQHVKRYEAWAKEAIQSCRRCARGACGECLWKACSCRAAGHKAVA